MPAGKKTLASRAGAVVRRAVKRAAAPPDGQRSNGSSPTKSAAAPAKKAATKASAKKATAKKAPAKKATAKKAPAKKATATKAPARKAAAKKAPATTAPADEGPAKTTATKRTARRGSAAALVVRPGESPWTNEELGEVRAHLRADVLRLEPELEHADADLHDLMIDSGDGSGQDQADMGSSTFERDHELSIANNAREMLDQSRHALERIQDGSFGVCEGCGEPIGKLRLMAFPRATLCLTCKQREERR